MTWNYRNFTRIALCIATAGAASASPSEIPDSNVPIPATNDGVITHVVTLADSGHMIVTTTAPDLTIQPYALTLDRAGRYGDSIILAQAENKHRQEGDREAWAAYQKAYALVLEEKWKEAATALADVERKYSRSAWADDARFWNIYSLEKSGRNPEEIMRMYEEFLGTFRGSAWSASARTNLITLANRYAASGRPEYAEKVRMLAERDHLDVSLSALVALQNMGDDSLPEIIRLYETSSNPELRERIITSLGVVSTPKVIDLIIRIAETDSISRIRHHALNLLGIRTTARFGPGIEVFDGSRSITVASSQGALKTPPSSNRGEDHRKILEAVKRVYRKDKDENVRAQAVFLIGQMGMTDVDFRIVETAAKTDPSLTVRTRALMGLWAAPDKKGLPFIIAVAKSDSDVNTRKAAIRYLGQSKDPRARAALVEIAAKSN